MKSRTKTIHFHYYSEIEDRNFEGQITIKIMTMKDVLKMEALATRLVDSQEGVNDAIKLLARAIATVNVCILNPPEWAKLDNLLELIDETVIVKLYEEVDKFQVFFRDSIRNESGGVREAKEARDNVLCVEEGAEKH